MLKFSNLKGHRPDGPDDKGGPDGTRQSADFRGRMEPAQETAGRAAVDEKGQELYEEAFEYCKETFAGVRRDTPISMDECSRIIHSSSLQAGPFASNRP